MSVHEIKAWKTADGIVFENKEEADRYNKLLYDFQYWSDERRGPTDMEDVLKWCKIHRRELKSYIDKFYEIWGNN